MNKYFDTRITLELIQNETGSGEMVLITMRDYPVGLAHIDHFWNGLGDNSLYDLLSSGEKVQCATTLTYEED